MGSHPRGLREEPMANGSPTNDSDLVRGNHSPASDVIVNETEVRSEFRRDTLRTEWIAKTRSDALGLMKCFHSAYKTFAVNNRIVKGDLDYDRNVCRETVLLVIAPIASNL